MRGKLDEARKNLNASLAKGADCRSADRTGACRCLGGTSGRSSRPRARECWPQVRMISRRWRFSPISKPNSRTIRVAAELYRRALAVQDSPALRTALARLPTSNSQRTGHELPTNTRFLTQVFCPAGVRWCGLSQARRQTVTLTEGTNIAATVSPDQKTIIMDLQGSLWSIPFQGGAAKQTHRSSAGTRASRLIRQRAV